MNAKTSEDMTDENKNLLLKYLLELSNSSQCYDFIGKSVTVVSHFLEHVDKVNKKEYKRYMKEYAALYYSTRRVFRKEILIPFMTFAGVGWRKYKPRKIKLDKLSAISERNRKKINEFVDWLPTQYDFSEHTIAALLSGVTQFFGYCNEFTNENVRLYISKLEELGRKPQTIQLRITALMKFGKFIGKDIKIKRPKAPRKLNLEDVPTEAEYNKLLEWLKSEGKIRNYLYVRILATSGCRLSEFLQLKWGDVVKGEIVLRCKGNKYRRLFFPESLQKEVADYLSDEVTADDYVAICKYGTPIKTRSLNVLMKDWGAKVGIDKKKMHAHAFRHFFAKKFLENNKNDVMSLADMLGHNSLETTRIYTQKSYDEQKREYHKTVTW